MRGIRAMGLWLTAATLVAMLVAAPARASTTQESIIQDDPLLLNARSQAQVDAALKTLRDVGADRVRVSLFWGQVAPERSSQSKPRFPAPGAAWPGSYPAGSWRRYDRIVVGAQRAGIGLLFTVTGPAPAWATPGAPGDEGTDRPGPQAFADFVKAAGIRYSGAYPVDAPPPPPRNGPLVIGGVQIGPGEPPPPQSDERLPRVNHWSIWNEPNYPTWLTPIWLHNRPRRPSQMVAAAPHHYRRLVDAAYRGLDASGHGRDTVLIGETAPRGGKRPTQLGNAMAPAEFTRELFCLDARLRPYKGRAAKRRNCPASAAARRAFHTRHSGLFRASGWAHHPYSLDRRGWRLPTWRHPLADNVPIANLGRLTRTLDRADRVWGNPRRMPVWITEYGYQTTPPDPTAGVRPTRQGPLTAWGEYLAYRNPRVASIAQFLLFDDGPVPGYREGDRRRWVSWQSGLLSADGQPKPFFADYQRAIHVVQRRRTVRVFGDYRPAATGAPLQARIEFAPPRGRWGTLRAVSVHNLRGYLSAGVTVPGRGLVRIVWFDPQTSTGAASGAAPVR